MTAPVVPHKKIGLSVRIWPGERHCKTPGHLYIARTLALNADAMLRAVYLVLLEDEACSSTTARSHPVFTCI